MTTNRAEITPAVHESPGDTDQSPEEGAEDSFCAIMDPILRHRQIIFVTGKGGVGKSVVSSLLALRAKSLGLFPLLFECDAPPRPSLLPKARETNSILQEVTPGILAINQNSDEAVKEYANSALPSKLLADLLIENRISRLFLRASPSVNEMALVGRILQLAEQHQNRGPVIVDLYATGHALHMLRAPDGIMRVLRTGPVFERAKTVHNFLFHKEQTSVITVAQPEELPVTESIEFIEALSEMGAPLGPVIMNGMFQDPSPNLSDRFWTDLGQQLPNALPQIENVVALKYWANRCSREQGRFKESVARFDLPVLSLPFIIELPKRETIASVLSARMTTSGETPKS
jgi:anion-transporting  ArsA/GET3 family ATPase